MTKITELTKQLGEILSPFGYKKAGKNFYRVQGDGVIVFFGFDYERTVYGHILRFGFSSLYNPQLKSPKELIPTVNLLTCGELKKFSHLEWSKNAQLTPQAVQSGSEFMKFLYSGAEEQNQKRNAREFEILRETDFLKRIEKLSDFAQAEAFMIEMTERDGKWFAADHERYFYELLSVCEYEDAIKVFRSIEKRNYWIMYMKAYQKSSLYRGYNFEEDRKDFESYLAPMRKFVRLLEENKVEEVQRRLQEIYAHNLATFGVRKKKRKKTSNS